MRRWPILVPLGIFLALLSVFAVRLVQMNRGQLPNEIGSVMVDKQVETFSLPALLADKPGLSSADFAGKVTLVNFFASWCVPCRLEHPLLAALAGKVDLVGINYKNDPLEAKAWLVSLGDPYRAIAVDRDGRVGIVFGVYAVPESYLVDRQGRIRYAWKKPFTVEEIQTTLLPLIAELNK